jgi:glycosyltransferase involved in cell wall biosynthesis
VFTAHNILPHEHSKVDGFLRALVYRAASTVIVHTDKIKSDLLDTYALDADKIFVVPAVKPVAGTRDQSITRSSAREKLNIAASAKVLLFFGYIREYKGLDLLLDAFDIAREKVDDLILIVAGKPHTEELLQRYQRQIVLMEHAQHVFFRPEFIPKEDVDDYFKASDALAMPYTHIDFSGIVQEAFAYKKPVLATNVGNFSDVISDGENGYIAEQNTAEAFARMIECAFADMAKLSQMGQTAYEIDAAYPNQVQIGEMTVQVYSAR